MYQDFYIFNRIIKLSYSCNFQIVNCSFNIFQDLPEHFEENMEKWMKNFLILLTIDSKQLNLEVLLYSLLNWLFLC